MKVMEDARNRAKSEAGGMGSIFPQHHIKGRPWTYLLRIRESTTTSKQLGGGGGVRKSAGKQKRTTYLIFLVLPIETHPLAFCTYSENIGKSTVARHTSGGHKRFFRNREQTIKA